MAIKKKFIGADQVDQAKVLLDNNSALRAKNAAGTAVELIKLDGSDVLKLLKLPQVSNDPSSGDDLVRKSFLDGQISSAQTGLESLIDGVASDLSAEVSRATAAEEALDGRLDIVEPKVTTLEGEMDAVEGRATSLEGRMSTAEGEIDTLQSEMDAVEGRMSTAEGDISSLEGRMDSAESSLATKAATSYVDSQLALKVDSSEVGSSIAQLVNGKLPISQTPAIAITEVSVVETIAQRDALVIGSGDGEIQEGDVCVVSGEAKSYIYTGSSWQELLHPAYDPAGVQAQIDGLDSRLDIAESDIDSLEGRMSTAEGDIESLEGRMSTAETDINNLETDLATEQTARESADDALDSRLDIIEGSGEGSVAKAEQDAKDYADSLMSTEQAARESADNALDSRLDVLEGSGAGSVAKAQSDAQSYADGLISTEQSARIAGDEALDARLDVLEGSGEGSVAKAEQDAKDYADSAIAALTTSDIEEGSNLYFTEARAQQAVVEDAIVNGITLKAPSQNVVYDALAQKLETSLKGAANGLAELGADGKIPSAQLPALAISEVHVVATIAARDALTVESGDVAKVTATNRTYIYDGSAWIELSASADVASVNGQTGTVVLDTDDVSEGITNQYFTAARAKTAAVADQIANGITDVAPSQNAVYDAMATEESARIAGDASALSDAKAYTDAQLDTLVIQQQQYTAKTLASGDVSNGYVDVSGPIVGTPWIMVDGVMGRPSVDFTHSGSRITFQGEWASGGASAMASGDVVHIFFMKEYSPFV